jgi:hypothetical protein
VSVFNSFVAFLNKFSDRSMKTRIGDDVWKTGSLRLFNYFDVYLMQVIPEPH